MPTLNYNPTPTAEPTVSPPSTFQTIQPAPNAFGAAQGQALSNLGQTVERAGTQLADIAVARQHIFNQVAAADATNNWQDATTKILYGDPNDPTDVGFYGLKGKAAMDAFPRVRQQLDSLLKDQRGVLQNPIQQVMFDQETRRLRSYLMSETGRHYDQENNRWTQSVYKGQSEQALQGAAKAIASGNDFDLFLKQGADAIVKGAITAGKSEDEAKADVNKFTTTILEMQADKLSADDPRAALEFIQNHRDQFKDPEKFLQLQNRVKTQAVKKTAQDIANGVPGPGLGGGLVRGGALDNITVPSQYQGLVSNAAMNYGVPEELLTRVLHAESGFNPNAVSPTGARGIAQFIQSTANQYGVDRNDPKSSIAGAAHYLSDLKKQEGTWAGALSKYLGSDPTRDPSYRKSGAIQLAQQLDSGGTPQAPSGGLTMTEGDSIGVGFKGTGLAGNPVGGRNPQAVLDNINTNLAANPDYYKGQTVLLSGGTMNDPRGAQTQLIKDQIAKIQKAQGNVILAGADTGKFAGRNAELEQIAKDAGVPFAGPLPTNNVHPGPQGYKDYAGAAAKLVSAPPQDQLIVPPPDPGEFPVPDAEVPGLVGALDRIAKDPRITNAPAALKGDLFKAAVQEARLKYNTAWVAQQRERTQQRQANEENDKQLQNDYLRRMASDSPNYPTVDEIKKDERIKSPAVRENLIGQLIRDTKGETDAKVSARNQRLLTIRMDPDYTGDDKITSEQQIRKAYNAGDLTRSDRDELVKDFYDQYDPSGPRWTKKINETLKGVEAKFVPMLLAMSHERAYSLDPTAGPRVQAWKEAVKSKITEYRDTGKNPLTLFQPGTKDKPNPEYVGGDAFIQGYVGNLNQKLQDKQPAAPPTPNPATTAISIDDINKMTTLPDLQKAVAANPGLTDAARARALELGVVRPSSPQAPMAQ